MDESFRARSFRPKCMQITKLSLSPRMPVVTHQGRPSIICRTRTPNLYWTGGLRTGGPNINGLNSHGPLIFHVIFILILFLLSNVCTPPTLFTLISDSRPGLFIRVYTHVRMFNSQSEWRSGHPSKSLFSIASLWIYKEYKSKALHTSTRAS